MTNKLTLLVAAASLTFAGAAYAQSTTTTAPGQTTSPGQTMTSPDASSANPADSAAAPSSASVASFKVGAAVKDAQGVPVGQITGTSTGADGSTNVIVTNGGVTFALPGNSLSAGADGSVSTTATKAQIDATVAGAKPQ